MALRDQLRLLTPIGAGGVIEAPAPAVVVKLVLIDSVDDVRADVGDDVEEIAAAGKVAEGGGGGGGTPLSLWAMLKCPRRDRLDLNTFSHWLQGRFKKWIFLCSRRSFTKP